MGTTAEKLTYLNETKTKLKDMLNLGGASLTTEPFRQYVDTLKNRYLYLINNGTQEVWDNWEKVVGEGTTITLNNTEEAPMKIVLKGNTLQNGTPTPEAPQDIHVVSGNNSIEVGNNVFDISTITPNSFIDNNGNIYASFASNLSDYIEVKENDIILSYDYTSLVSTSTRAYCWFDSNKNFISGHLYSPVNKTNTFNVVSGAKYIRFTYDKNISNIKVSNQSASYPINLGDIELCKIGDYQDSIKKSTGKNLLDLNRTLGQPSDTTASNTTKRKFNYNEVVKGISGNNYYYHQFVTSYNIQNQTISMTTGATATYSLGFPIKIKANTTYTMSFDKNSTNGRVQVSYYTSDGTHLNYESKIASFTFTTPSNCDFILINFTGIEANTTYIFTNCMLNEGSTALPYEPYGTGWYLNKQIGKVVLDENISMDYNGTAGKFYKENQNICPNYKSNTSMLSNYLLYSSTTWVKNCFGITASNVFWLYIENGPTSLADLRTWLSTHNTEVYYQLSTPTYTLIEDSTLLSQLNALAKSYASQTNISQENNDLASILNATALKEMA